jgi:hypothetical protein
VNFYFFANSFDNTIDESMMQSLTWEETVELFSEHLVTEDKNFLAYVAQEFNTGPTARPAERVEYDADGVTIKAIHPKLKPDGTPWAGRYADNVVAFNAICLDSDKGWEIDEAKEALAGIRHLGYTSWSHGVEGKGTRFRVVIPLTDPCPAVEWQKRRASIQATFPTVDASFCDRARVMYAPAVSADRLHLAETWRAEGVVLDWRDFEPAAELPAYVPRAATGSTSKDGLGKVVHETFDMVQFVKDQGLYQKQVSHGQHKVTCPQFHVHTGQDKSGTVMWQNGGWPSFHCAHGACHGFKFYEHYKNQLGKGWMDNYCEREQVEISTVAKLRAILKKGKK